MELRSMVYDVGRAWRLVALAAIVGCVLAGASVIMLGPTYRASTTVLALDVDPSAGAEAGPRDPRRYLETQAALVRSDAVLGAVAAELGLSLRDFDEDVSTVAEPDDDTIVIEVQAPTAASAKERADAVASAYRDVARQLTTERLQRQLTAVEQRAASIEAEIVTAQAAAALPGEDPPTAGARLAALVDEQARLLSERTDLAARLTEGADPVRILRAALVPQRPSPLRPLEASILGAALSGMAAAAVALLRPQFSGRLGAAPGAAIDGLPVITHLPPRRRNAGVAADLERGTPFGAAAGLLAAQVADRPGRWVAVLGAGPGAGAALVASAVAVAARDRNPIVPVIIIAPDQRDRSVIAALMGQDDTDPPTVVSTLADAGFRPAALTVCCCTRFSGGGPHVAQLLDASSRVIVVGRASRTAGRELSTAWATAAALGRVPVGVVLTNSHGREITPCDLRGTRSPTAANGQARSAPGGEPASEELLVIDP